MAKLILSFENTVLKTVKLDKERVMIGRRPDNDIQVDNLGVSGQHAVVTTLLNDSVIEDLNSTNGTLVNGQPITKHLLQDNDVIEVGKHKLKFVVEAAAAAATYVNLEKTMVIRRPTAGMPPAAPAPQHHADLEPNTVGLKPAMPQAAPKEAPVVKAPTVPHTPVQTPAAAAPVRAAAVQVLSGNAVGRVVDLSKPLTSIGKAGVQVAVLTRRPNGFFITHVEGATFPTVNGVQISKQAQLLNENDTIEIAGIKMTFFYKS
ncbi:MAG TPA: FHA domain-containing protein [Burkholderiaceae bacterium]|jgi:predicted component of type VI protein secretion system